MRQPPADPTPAGAVIEWLTAGELYLALVRVEGAGLTVQLPGYVTAAGHQPPAADPAFWQPVLERLQQTTGADLPIRLLAEHAGRTMAVRAQPIGDQAWLVSWQPAAGDVGDGSEHELLAGQQFDARHTAAVLDRDGTVLAAEPGYPSVVGGERPDGRYWPSMMGDAAAAAATELLAELAAGGTVDQLLPSMRDRPRWFRIQGRTVRPGGAGRAVIVVQIEDLTEPDGASLAAGLLRDPLTGAYNRRALLDLASLPATSTARYQGMLLVDVRGFRRINELWGQQVGDGCLIETARWLGSLTNADELLVRLSGSQFMVLCVAGSTIVSALAGSSSRPIKVGRHQILLSLQAGWAPREPGAALLRCAEEAETALRVAKRDAWRTVVVWTAEIAQQAGQAAAAEEAVLQAVAARQETVRFQPIVNLAQQRVSGMEALVRMGEPAAHLSTDRILAASHKLGLTPQLAERVYDLAFTEGLQLRTVFPGCLLGVNVSREFLSTGLAIDTVLGSASRAGVPLAEVVVELTEDLAAGLSLELLTSEARRAAEAGLQLVIDDFGRGETSLALLRRLPLAGIKLDRSLLPLDGADRDWAFVEATVRLLGQLTDRIIAEGVETELQSHRLRELGIVLQQGYLFGAPETSQHWLDGAAVLPAG